MRAVVAVSRTFVTCTLAYVARFPCKVVEKVGTRAKEKNEGEGGGERRKGFLFSPLPPPSHVFLPSLHLSRNNSIENAGYVHPHKSPVAQWWRVWSSNQNSGGSSGGACGARPSPYF